MRHFKNRYKQVYNALYLIVSARGGEIFCSLSYSIYCKQCILFLAKSPCYVLFSASWQLMALYKYEGKWYCEAKDLSLSVERLSLCLHRGRKDSESFQNIRNPYYHGRNSKRLVLLESLPSAFRKQVEAKLLSLAPRPPLAGEENGH